MYATAVVRGKVVRFKLSPALARAHRENRGKSMTEAERRLRSSKPSDAYGRCDEPDLTFRVVLDTCILKVATFPAENSASAIIQNSLLKLSRLPRLLSAYGAQCHPARTGQPLSRVRSFRRGGIHRHREHRTRALRSQAVSIGERGAPGEFLNVPEVGRLVKKFIEAESNPSLRRLILWERLGASRVRFAASRP
jgi:hypothetical protein